MFTLPPHRWIASVAIVASLALSGSAFAGEPGGDASAGEDWVLVPGHYGADNAWITGFYREPSRLGEIWIAPHVGDHAIRVPGHWVPEAPDDGEAYTWVRGYRDDEGAWVPGFWRVAHAEDFEWVSGYYDREGRWISGHWRPNAEQANSIWVPGHIHLRPRLWRIGFWRPTVMDGFVWIDGYYADGLWYAGYWSPMETQQGLIWVPGYPHDLLWRIGYWRPFSMHGHTWVPGHWHSGLWVAGFWAVGAWHRPLGITICHYAHYHHHHGHNHRHAHRRVRQTRYASYQNQTTSTAEPRPATPSADSDRDAATTKTHIWSETARPRPSSARRRPAVGREHEARRPLPATNPRYPNPPIRPASKRKTDASEDAASRPAGSTERGARKRRKVPRRPEASPSRRKVPAARPNSPHRRQVPTKRPQRPRPAVKATPAKRPAVKPRPVKRAIVGPQPVVRPEATPPPQKRLPDVKRKRVKTKRRVRPSKRRKRPSRDERR